jgi:hypothetical protein
LLAFVVSAGYTSTNPRRKAMLFVKMLVALLLIYGAWRYVQILLEED